MHKSLVNIKSVGVNHIGSDVRRISVDGNLDTICINPAVGNALLGSQLARDESVRKERNHLFCTDCATLFYADRFACSGRDLDFILPINSRICSRNNNIAFCRRNGQGGTSRLTVADNIGAIFDIDIASACLGFECYAIFRHDNPAIHRQRRTSSGSDLHIACRQ